MRILKYTHSLVRLEKSDRALVIDPGSFSEEEPLDGAEAVLITHEHTDHLDVDKLSRHPDLQIWTNAATASLLTDVDPDRLHVVAAGEDFIAAGFEVSVYGELHEVIHPDLPPVPNIGFFVDDSFFHPGDAFTVPDRPVDTLMVPTSAPWLKSSESIDYIRAVRPRLAVSVHDGLLNDIGLGLVDNLVGGMAEQAGSEFRRLASGGSIDI
ncbi:L-ascorbate metabolism protein UlaG, beta-lactamase superfamily [Actinopolymorpha cephalotaxi]|uniref:L-ascorbate metabolism protein UlaG (Beta-lactamase superfamily) n=1 Tax=Actinopolymorpha cephalotaxi TaxID=504797 RepID=A0A1I2YTK2_9ACTN|nr:MBL fold metallo-hydrolase [Actinopolymorpha cephalotaxi]NYH81687.1 L-ascorbate metabolism protein UlaG (beta-lactamase superfamily) [Actinopolymorpha cephalotaxi]SFH28968.1 L-ascorbate metabolism protein UlaG, beta-lactamase superfamily [Actinopolymorpha cephalotaxi]